MLMLRMFVIATLVMQPVLSAIQAESQTRDPAINPILKVDLRSYGFSLPKVSSWVQMIFGDVGPHLAVLSEDRAIVYHKLPDNLKDVDSAGTLLAYVIDLSSGSLIRKEQWRANPRQNPATDAEPLIEPLSAGRYLVMAGGFLYLYDFDGNLQMKKPLGLGIWAIQAVQNGEQVLLRHGLAGTWTTYAWLDSRTLESTATFTDIDPERYLYRMRGTGRWLLFLREDGVYGLSPDGTEHLLCAEVYCRWRNMQGSSPTGGGAMITSRFGIGAMDIGKGMLWFRAFHPNEGLDRVTPGPIATSQDGSRGAFMVSRGSRYREFDGVKLRANEEIFTYRVADGERLVIVPFGADEFAFTPSGHKLVNAVGTGIEIYAIP